METIGAVELDRELILEGVKVWISETGNSSSASTANRLLWEGELHYSLPTQFLLIKDRIGKLKAQLQPCKLMFADDSVCLIHLDLGRTMVDIENTEFRAAFKVKEWLSVGPKISMALPGAAEVFGPNS